MDLVKWTCPAENSIFEIWQLKYMSKSKRFFSDKIISKLKNTRCRTWKFQGMILDKNMDKQDCSAANFIPKTLLDVICIIESDESQYSWKLIRNLDSFSLVVKSRAKNANPTPLKDGASGQPASHQVKSDDTLRKRRKQIQKSPSTFARDREKLSGRGDNPPENLNLRTPGSKKQRGNPFTPKVKRTFPPTFLRRLKTPPPVLYPAKWIVVLILPPFTWIYRNCVLISLTRI